ncbi:AAA family ATPase [bacterium]|nr:AAA family ATPase [bacterium]
MFFGRLNEMQLLENYYDSPKGELVVMYGRRRIGKSSLIKVFTEKKTHSYSFEAVESQNTQEQISHFINQLAEQTGDSFLKKIPFTTWSDALNYLTDKVITQRKRKKKLVLVFDELQWMATKKSTLVSLLKFYWDNFWKEESVMLILCGSIASFMIDKVLHSKALYGRITAEIHLQGLPVIEAQNFFGDKRSKEEILKYLMIFGTVPKYLEMIDLRKSFEQNMDKLCFSKHAIMIHEVDRIFYSQFVKEKNYLAIVDSLKSRIRTLGEIGSAVGIPSGGGLKRYLENLTKADIISQNTPWDKPFESRIKKYRISDEFLNFFYKFIEPNRKLIANSPKKQLFKAITSEKMDVWLGFAFERFALKHSSYLAELMGFSDQVATAGSLFSRDDTHFQIDLIYKRFDKVITICEIKHHNKKITAQVIKEVERKKSLIKIPRGYTLETALISLYGPDKGLKESGFFTHTITLDNILND